MKIFSNPATPELAGLTDPRVIAYQKRVAELSDPNIILFDKVLTDDDKQMLAALNQGNWQQDGPASHLVDQIATARHDGTLTGPISSSFIQNIIEKQEKNTRHDPEQKLDPISQSVLDNALEWIKQRSQQAAATILGTTSGSVPLSQVEPAPKR